MTVITEQAPAAFDFAAAERELAGEDRRAYLESLPHRGFNEKQRQELIDEFVAIGYPLGNIKRLRRRRNTEKTKNVMASYRTDGVLTAYELRDAQVPEKRLNTDIHENAHAVSPIDKVNAHFYGGEAQRQQHEAYAVESAAQALMTNTYIDGYQAWLANELSNNQISFGEFVEESQAIASALAITNRAKLAQVEAAQHAKAARLQKAGQLNPNIQPVNLLSHGGQDGKLEADGIDKQLIALLDGVSTPEELIAHAGQLKAQFYPTTSAA